MGEGYDLIQMIGNMGFPIAVSTYLLIRIEGKLTTLSSAISDLTKTIDLKLK